MKFWPFLLILLALPSWLIPESLSSTTPPTFTFPQGFRVVSQLPNQTYVEFALVFPPRNLALLEQYVQQGVVLSEEQALSLFSPQSQVDRAVSYLNALDISTQVLMGNVVLGYGEVSLVEKALGGRIVVLSNGTLSYYTYQGTLRPPLSNALLSLGNLTEAFLTKPQFLITVKPDQAIAYNYLTPSQLREAYNVTLNGSGTTIGILDFYGDPYIQDQLKAFDQQYGLPDPPNFTIVPIGPCNPEAGIPTQWALEVSLDMEYAHAISPGARLVLYVADPSLPLPAIIAFIDQQDRVDVLSQSFGVPEIYVALGQMSLGLIQSLIYEYMLGEVEGITFVAASGDGGGNGYDFFLSPYGNSVIPSSIPYILSVGGTSLYVSGNESLQTAWSGNGLFGASTGGYSIIFPSPWYQGGVGFRATPDVAADANPYTGVKVLYYQGVQVITGGTSLASPIVSAILAQAIQVHGRLGFVNPLIYALNGTKAIEPVKFGYNTPYTASTGLVTGLGTLNAGYLVNLLHRPSTSIWVATYNSTFADGQVVKVVANFTSKASSPTSVPLKGYVYNGSATVESFPLKFNGTLWVGNFTAVGSGVLEVIVRAPNAQGSTYVTVGYQAVFLRPEVAVYQELGQIPVAVQIVYPNGTTVQNFQPSASLYYYDALTGELRQVTSTPLTKISFLQLIGLLLGVYNGFAGAFTMTESYPQGTYFVRVSDTFGFDQFVWGIYLVPVIFPAVGTEPLVLYPGENAIAEALLISSGYPNVTLSFYNSSGKLSSIPVHMVQFNGVSAYLTQFQVPELSPGYYYVVAYASYNTGNLTLHGVGETQIYVSKPLSMKVHVSPSQVYQNGSVEVEAQILYPNGTPVRFGTFNAVVIPSFAAGNFEGLQLLQSIQLSYSGGLWVGNFTVPSGNSPNLYSLSPEALSGYWDVFVQGISADGHSTQVVLNFNFSTLNFNPPTPQAQFVVLPYVNAGGSNITMPYPLGGLSKGTGASSSLTHSRVSLNVTSSLNGEATSSQSPESSPRTSSTLQWESALFWAILIISIGVAVMLVRRS